jgi:DNA-binding NarL/FixJ family response regulator
MDSRIPGTDGLDATRLICADEELAGVRLLVLTSFEADEYVDQAFRVVARGDALLSPGITRRLIADFVSRPDRRPLAVVALQELTAREREVMALIAGGLSSDEIATKLVVSPLKVQQHMNGASSNCPVALGQQEVQGCRIRAPSSATAGTPTEETACPV